MSDSADHLRYSWLISRCHLSREKYLLTKLGTKTNHCKKVKIFLIESFGSKPGPKTTEKLLFIY